MEIVALLRQYIRTKWLGIKKEEAFRVALQAETTRDFAPQLEGITVGLSSGTSGNRGLFLVGPQEQAKWAGTILAKALPGSLWAEQRIAFFLLEKIGIRMVEKYKL